MKASPYHNAVFVGMDRNGTPRYACLRGIGTDFKGEATGSDKRFSFALPATGESRMLCVFESAIDLLSYATMAQAGGLSWRSQHLTDEQVQRLLDAVRELPPYVFIMLGLYAGLRREEILGLQWDSVYLDTEAPYLTVRRAWHTEHNRPVISTELKTAAAERNIPLPDHLAACLREAKKKSTLDFVVANRDGDPLSYTQFKRLWQYVVTRTAKPRIARKQVDGKYVKYMLYPELGEKAQNNGHVVYSLDFEVTPHLLRHTYITNLIHASVDPKTVQYLAGHENSRITMDIYAKVKYNRPDDVVKAMTSAFAEWDAS